MIHVWLLVGAIAFVSPVTGHTGIQIWQPVWYRFCANPTDCGNSTKVQDTWVIRHA